MAQRIFQFRMQLDKNLDAFLWQLMLLVEILGFYVAVD